MNVITATQFIGGGPAYTTPTQPTSDQAMQDLGEKLTEAPASFSASFPASSLCKQTCGRVIIIIIIIIIITTIKL